jgi:TRAP-type mannitol/chloroaromatic compound transport system permease large subunit
VSSNAWLELVWFGVLLAVNMQTSFLHPPFGFALFYFRSVAPSRETIDRMTGRRVAPVATGQIYWGSVPFVAIQLTMVAIVIAFPEMVLGSLDAGPKIDPTKIPDRGAADGALFAAADRIQTVFITRRHGR